jgi:ABC-2 type transport system permease protein
MRTILTLLYKDLANFSRDRTAVCLTFLVPIALIYIFGQVFGISRKDSGPSGIRVAVVNESAHPAAKKLVQALKDEKALRVVTEFENPDKSTRPLALADLQPLMRADKFRFAVVIPQNVVSTDRLGVNLKILSNPRNEIETQTVNGILQKTMFSSAPELLGQSVQEQAKQFLGQARYDQFTDEMAGAVAAAFGGDRTKIRESIAAGNFVGFLGGGLEKDKEQSEEAKKKTADLFSRVVNVEHEQVAGQQVKSPAATRVVGGWAMMFLLFAVSGSAAAFFDEKKAGLFQRLLSAPVRRAHLLWSRFLFGVALGLVQLTALFFAGRLLYDIDVMGNFGNLLVICVAAAAACTAFGMLVAAFSPSAAAAQGIATFLVLVMSATGGAWFPVSFMPEFMQQVAKFTLVYWSMEGFSQVLWEHRGFVEILPTVGILLGIAGGVMAVAIWRFSKGRLFE